MNDLILRRFFSNQYGTRSAWMLSGGIYIRVLEPQEPVIPAGDYVLNRHESPTLGLVLRFEDPLNTKFAQRELYAHIGNVARETTGCNLVGNRFGIVDFTQSDNPEKRSWGKLPGILGSKETFEMIMAQVPNGTRIHVEGMRT